MGIHENHLAYRTCIAGALTDTFTCTPNACIYSNLTVKKIWQQKSIGNCPNNTLDELLLSSHSCVPECEIGLVPFGSHTCLAGEIIDTFECLVPWYVAFASIGAGLLICCLIFSCLYFCRKTGCCCGCAKDCAPGGGDDGSSSTPPTKILPSEPSRMLKKHDTDEKGMAQKVAEDQEKHRLATEKRLKERRASMDADAAKAAQVALLAQQKDEEAEAERLRVEEGERLRKAEELKAKNAALYEKQQKEIEEAKNKLTTAVASNDPTTLQSILEDLENDPEYVLEALATEMKQAQELLATLSAALSAAAQAELMQAKIDQAQQDLKNVMNKVKMCSAADKSYMETLPEGERHLNAIQNDKDLVNVMKSEVEQARTVLANKTTEIQLNILEEIQNAMKDKENGDQYDRLKLALNIFDTFDPDMNSPSNAVLIGEARRMLEMLYEVWRLKQLLMNLDQKAIAQVKAINKPIDEVHQVIRAVLLLLGEDPKDLQDWKSCRVNISRTGKESLKRRISAFSMDTVTDKAQVICEKIMSKIDLKRIEAVSSVVAIFYAFCAGALKLKKVE